MNSTKEDKHLLRQLYMTMHVRERNSDRLFEVENADCPPSLYKHAILRSDQKSDLLSCLEVECPSDVHEDEVKLIDGAHLVYFYRPDASIKSFRDYADKKVIPYIERQLANTKRVDVIWDRYLPDSLKATTRQRRGTGIRQRMRHDWNWTFPRNWNSYLQNVSNKVELFNYHVNESFVISSYSVTCTLTDVNGFNQARHHIFAQSSRTFENLRRRKQPW